MHSTTDVDDGYLGSGRRIKAEIKKYGKENFVREILEHLLSREALCKREAEIVTEDLLSNPLCLNLKNGGEGGGKIWNDKHAANFHVAGYHAMNVSLSAEQRSVRSAKAQAKRKENGNSLPFPLAAIEAARFSEKRKATFADRGHMQGEKNSQFGTCWVTNGVKPVKIKKEQLDEYLAKGFIRGRKFHAATTC